MTLTIKNFDELTTRELHSILKVRAEIFVVEQNCPYLDVDDIDLRSLHMYLEESGSILAYLRVFDRIEEPGALQMGRVLSKTHGKGHGGMLLHQAMEYIEQNLKPSRIFIEAQCYAKGFYEKEGFVVCSDEFLEDGIPHVGMEKNYR